MPTVTKSLLFPPGYMLTSTSNRVGVNPEYGGASSTEQCHDASNMHGVKSVRFLSKIHQQLERPDAHHIIRYIRQASFVTCGVSTFARYSGDGNAFLVGVSHCRWIFGAVGRPI